MIKDLMTAPGTGTNIPEEEDGTPDALDNNILFINDL